MRRVDVKRRVSGGLVLWLTASCFGQSVCPKHIETPTYPVAAQAARVEGKVTLRVTLDAEGNVTNAEVADDLAHQANPTLREAAINNMMHWTFEKPTSAPVTQLMVYQYRFDGSLPLNDHQNPITKVNIDLPDHVTILANETTWNPSQSKKKKQKASVP